MREECENGNPDCIVCKTPAKIAIKDFNGYLQGEFFNIYFCSFCNTSFVWPQSLNLKLYNKIYEQAEVVPGYNRYELYARTITKKKRSLQYLANKEPMYFAVMKILSEAGQRIEKILEVGSGLGYLTYAISKEGYDITGLDISEDAVKKAEMRFGKKYICADLYNYSLNNNQQFDLIILTEVIEHVQDPVGFCKVLKSLLKPNGKLVISTPNKSAFPQAEFWNTELPPVHLAWFSEKSFKSISDELDLSLSFFDFTSFNNKHFDFTKYKFYKSFNERHKRVPTMSYDGKVLDPSSLENKNILSSFIKYLKAFIKRVLILSPLIDKTNMQRGAFLCAILQKNS